MPFIISYLIKFSISLAAVYAFYQLVLRRLTFYQWNRFYLLGYVLLCFVIPFIHIESWIQRPAISESRLITIIPALGQYPAVALAAPAGGTTHAAAAAWTLYDWLALVFLTGVIVMALRFALLFGSLQRMRRRSVLLGADSGVWLYETEAPITPFSFGRSVYFNATRHTEEELKQIIRHEYVHIQQRHTIDLLAGELLCLFNWYNPFAWLMRYAIRQNLEFIADNQVLQNGIDKKEYQYLLLKVVGISHYRIANNFNFSNLKKRILMMNKMKSARLNLGRFLFVLPLLAVLLVAFRNYHPEGRGPAAKFMVTAGIVSDVYTKQPIEGAVVTEERSGVRATTDAKGFYKMELPVNAGHFELVAWREAYQSTTASYTPAPNNSHDGGLLMVMALVPRKKDDGRVHMFTLIYSKRFSEAEQKPDPSYEDAVKGYMNYRDQQEDIDRIYRLIRNNPQVENFYSSEGEKKQIVFLKDGRIEKYGYPGTPSVAEMEKKYGKVPDKFTDNNGHEATWYNKQWQDISDRLSKTFRPSGNEAKTILFPGDSRVLVQFANNKMEMYDMDYQQDRDKFENRFGKLPGLPPAGRSDVPSKVPASADTTVPGSVKLVNKQTGEDMSIKPAPGMGDPLYVLDDVPLVAGSGIRTINPSDIEAINILKDQAAIDRYGERARNGVVEIFSKKYGVPVRNNDTIRIKTDTLSWSADSHRLRLIGRSKLLADGNVITAGGIHYNVAGKQIAMDGRLLDLEKDFTRVFSTGNWVIYSLDGTAAEKKYGNKAVSGVLEISNL